MANEMTRREWDFVIARMQGQTSVRPEPGAITAQEAMQIVPKLKALRDAVKIEMLTHNFVVIASIPHRIVPNTRVRDIVKITASSEHEARNIFALTYPKGEIKEIFQVADRGA